ncbi:hypothetical protein Glove_66g45 [Diversispora epigaea]|uniref:Uncharacterized protein n=1 Tax=Diversispora epigaea TaxID=1348612 RepID=A0A397JBK1_9GLOM|nr:hypothetical protein Glove_66g45 [Diversispora epigaea]
MNFWNFINPRNNNPEKEQEEENLPFETTEDQEKVLTHQKVFLSVNLQKKLCKFAWVTPRQNHSIVNPIAQEVEARNIEENILNLVNNFDNLNIYIAQNQFTPQELSEKIQQVNPNNLKQLLTMDRQLLARLITAMTTAITNNQQNPPVQNQPGPAVNISKISVHILTFRRDPRENISA